MSLTKYTCKRCGHKWIPRTENPGACPECHSANWNKPRTGNPPGRKPIISEKLEKNEIAEIMHKVYNLYDIDTANVTGFDEVELAFNQWFNSIDQKNEYGTHYILNLMKSGEIEPQLMDFFGGLGLSKTIEWHDLVDIIRQEEQMQSS